MLTVALLYLERFPLLLAVDLGLDEDDPARWHWGVAGFYFRARVGRC